VKIFLRKTLVIYHSNIKVHLVTLLFCCSWTLSPGQSFYIGFSSNWDDSFREWSIYSIDTTDNEQEELLKLKWPFKEDWTEWVIEEYELNDNIRQKWPNNPNRWEYRSIDNIIDIQPFYRNNLTEWLIKYDDYQITWKSEYKNDLNLWFLNHKELGYFELITSYENDPRDWEIIDEAPDLPDDIKQAIIFITIWSTCPRQ